MDSNVGKWDAWYKNLNEDDAIEGVRLYGDPITFKMASHFLQDVDELEDWGCGTATFKKHYNGKYIGLDGSKTPWTDKIVDLCNYTSSVQGIIMRAVLEHNYEWQKILDNALKSFTSKFCLIIFTPLSKQTKVIANNQIHGVDVPDISFSREDIESRLRSAGVTWELVFNIDTTTGYRREHVFFIKKK